jgi:hypothetical protein
MILKLLPIKKLKLVWNKMIKILLVILMLIVGNLIIMGMKANGIL